MLRNNNVEKRFGEKRSSHVHVCKLRMLDNQGYGPNSGLVGGVNRVRLVGGVNSALFAYTYVKYACPTIKVRDQIWGWSEV